MEMITDFFTPLTAWHWLGLCLILLGIELLVGTFDFLWVAVAAGLTALFVSFAPAPEAWTGLVGQLLFFSVTSIALLFLGRVVFAGMRNPVSSHPKLNARADSLVGKIGIVSDAFVAGKGRIKIGDTYWLAESVDGSDIQDGVTVTVHAAKSTLLKVEAV